MKMQRLLFWLFGRCDSLIPNHVYGVWKGGIFAVASVSGYFMHRTCTKCGHVERRRVR